MNKKSFLFKLIVITTLVVTLSVISGISLGKYVTSFNAGSFRFGATPSKQVETQEYSVSGSTYTHTYNVEQAGYYQLEVWGAAGGDCSTSLQPGVSKDGWESFNGGNGGYSVGTVYLDKGDTLYITLGGEGKGTTKAFDLATNKILEGGYNGGGSVTFTGGVNHVFGSGGGATHIATAPGTLDSLSGDRKSVLIVAGGGGGARNQENNWSTPASRAGHGGAGGGENGVGAVGLYRVSLDSNDFEFVTGVPGTQNSGFQFGLGESCNNNGAGGGGWYGGTSGAGGTAGGKFSGSGSGGSGYVSSDLLNAKTLDGTQLVPNYGEGATIPEQGVNIASLTELIGTVQYDSGVIVWLNGYEVYRSGNTGSSGSTPQWSVVTENHSTIQNPQTFTVSQEQLNECLVEGENVISAMVHNIANDDVSYFNLTLAGNSATTSSELVTQSAQWNWGTSIPDSLGVNTGTLNYWTTSSGWVNAGNYLWKILPDGRFGAGVGPLGYGGGYTFGTIIHQRTDAEPDYPATLYRTTFILSDSSNDMAQGPEMYGNDGNGYARITWYGLEAPTA